MKIIEFIKKELTESSEVKMKIISECSNDISDSIKLLVETFAEGRKLLLCGNGGSAADSQHIAAEFMVRLSHDLERPAIPAIALTTDSSFLTAGGNDIGYDNVFARGVEGLGNKGDVLIAISTSGNSKNVINAVNFAKEKGMKIIGFLGGNGGQMKSLCDISIIVPSEITQRIQEGHIAIAHIVCEAVERALYQ